MNDPATCCGVDKCESEILNATGGNIPNAVAFLLVTSGFDFFGADCTRIGEVSFEATECTVGVGANARKEFFCFWCIESLKRFVEGRFDESRIAI